MTLNVDLEDVPFAILEMVKARILAQRRKLEQPKQSSVVKGKRPQFTRFGANSKAYRMPKPAAMPDDDGLGVLSHLWIRNESTPALHSGMVAGGAIGFETEQPLPDGVLSGFAQLIVDKQIGQRHKATIAVGDGSEFIEINYGLPSINLFAGTSTSIPCSPSEPGSPFYLCNGTVTVAHASICSTPSLRRAVLPVGDGVFILLIDYDYFYSVAKSELSAVNHFNIYQRPDSLQVAVPQTLIAPSIKSSDYTLRAFCCTNSSIREILVPTSLKDAFNAVPIIKQSTVLQQTNYRFTAPVVTVQLEVDYVSETPLFDFPYGIFGNNGFGDWFLSPVTPAVFGGMATYANGARKPAIEQLFNNLAIQSFPSDGQWRVADTSQGYYQSPFNMLRDNPQLRYGIWTAEGEEPIITQSEDYDEYDEYYDTELYEPEAEYDFDIDPSADIFQQNDDPALTVIWDWGDPDYCRAMCKALGFTDADLTP